MMWAQLAIVITKKKSKLEIQFDFAPVYWIFQFFLLIEDLWTKLIYIIIN